MGANTKILANVSKISCTADSTSAFFFHITKQIFTLTKNTVIFGSFKILLFFNKRSIVVFSIVFFTIMIAALVFLFLGKNDSKSLLVSFLHWSFHKINSQRLFLLGGSGWCY